MDSVEVMQQQLAERIALLDRQRKDETARFEQEMAQRNEDAEVERRERIEASKAGERKRQEMEARAKEEEQRRAQEEFKVRQQLENNLNAAAEAKKLQEEKLAWLVNEISKQEFIEEQHRLSVQRRSAPAVVIAEPSAINIEHPEAPDNLGNAVQGTTGDTPSDSLMSDHLKTILRQAQRSY